MVKYHRRRLTKLNVFMNGELVGVWEQSRATSSFTYDESWLTSEYFRPISLSIPVTPSRKVSGKPVEFFFDNLLPDSRDIRNRLAAKYKTGDSEAFSLLTEVGRDCVGAIQIMPQDEEPPRVQQILAAPYSDADIAKHLRGIPKGALNIEDDEDELRLSIAGAQEKTALLKIDGQWYKPEGATPTTHLLKLPLGLVGGRKLDLQHSIENEWLCSLIARAFGIDVAECEIGLFEDQKALVVTRFDREFFEDGTWIIRIPQEDMCQALGFSSHMKYQRDGGPGIEEIHQLLKASAYSEDDMLAFYRTQVLFYLLVATDGHAKNFSISIDRGGEYALTPLYDVLSLSPIVGNGAGQVEYNRAKLAMAIKSKNQHYAFRELQYRHYEVLMENMNIANLKPGTSVLDEMLDQVDDVISLVEALVPDGFNEDTANRIFTGMRMQRDRLRIENLSPIT
ncbi:MAG: type II toxin-antitoxin system HipA family toxin [Formivibrio sp.]|nr:type II toxin-antitoxin system HipA family toxin [Formivibrio sp.]